MKSTLFCTLMLGTGLVFSGAAAEDVVISSDPAPGSSITIIQRTETPAPPPPQQQQVTVIKEPVAEMRVRHEAVVDLEGSTASSIIVKSEPPAPRQEVVRIETRPSDDYTWVPGYWRWDAARSEYEWVPGTWRRALPNMTWNPGRWERTDEGWRWVSGYWSQGPGTATATTTQTTVVTEAPPAPREEVRVEAPGADYTWIAGHWAYENGQYVWRSGRWERPIQEGMVWVPGRWVQTGNGYTFISGRWDYPVESRAYVITRVEGAPGTAAQHFDRDEDRVLPTPGPEKDTR